MSSGGGPSNTTQTVKNQLPKFARPFAQTSLAGLYDYLFPGGQMRQYPNPPQQVAGFTPQQISGMNQINSMASGQNPGVATANNLATQTETGQFLNPSTNPYLQATFDTAAQGLTNQYMDAIQPSIQSQFAQAGNFGSSAQADAQDAARYGFGQNMATLAADIFGGNYQQERQNQLQMAGLTPQLNQAQFINPSEQLYSGGLQQQLGQQDLNTAYQNMVNFNQYPQQVFSELSGALGPAEGNAGTQISTQPNPGAQSSLANTLIGGGASSLGLLAMMGLI